jgi:hypothetical protein
LLSLFTADNAKKLRKPFDIRKSIKWVTREHVKMHTSSRQTAQVSILSSQCKAHAFQSFLQVESGQKKIGLDKLAYLSDGAVKHYHEFGEMIAPCASQVAWGMLVHLFG